MEIDDHIENLSRHETARIVSVLTRIFGTDHLELAEDVVQDSLIEALTVWKEKGVPDDPTAWLFRVAKNKALNILNREKYKKEYSTEVSRFLQSEWTAEPALNHLFSEEQIEDDVLRMIFTCCHPSISPDSQIALALKTLCGFSIQEIAKAFLTTEENVNKRLVRARQKIREAKIPFEIPTGRELERRQVAVLETIYLLFNEGYSASRGDDLIRYELCEEAIRLAQMLGNDTAIQHKGNVYALLALMYLNASRFKARQDAEGNLLTMAEQDRELWDKQMQSIGLGYLKRSTENGDLTIYHILATVSANYCIAPDYESTDWKNILSLYDSLVQLDSSPIVLLNRAISLSKVYGAESGLRELERIKEDPSLTSYHLFYSTQAEFYHQVSDIGNAIRSLERAIQLATVPAEKDLLRKKKQLLEKNLA